MGLFGTVIGMIEIFGAQGGPGMTSNPAQLAHGISVALYNTAMGLLVAIPSMIFYRHYRAKVDALVVEMEMQAMKLVEIVHGERSSSDELPPRGSARGARDEPRAADRRAARDHHLPGGHHDLLEATRSCRSTCPSAEANAPLERPNQIDVAVTAQGQYVIQHTPSPSGDPAALAAALQRAAGGKPDPMIIINADAKATHQAVVNVMEAARLAGFSRITFTTQQTRR